MQHSNRRDVNAELQRRQIRLEISEVDEIFKRNRLSVRLEAAGGWWVEGWRGVGGWWGDGRLYSAITAKAAHAVIAPSDRPCPVSRAPVPVKTYITTSTYLHCLPSTGLLRRRFVLFRPLPQNKYLLNRLTEVAIQRLFL